MRMGAFFTGMASRNPYKGRAADPLAKLEQRAGDDTRKMLAAIQRNIVRLRGVVAGAKDPQQLRVRDKLYHEVYAAYAELGAKINGVLKGGVANAAMLSAEAVIGSLSAHGRDLFRFSMERAKRYWRYICPENGRSLAATMTDKMSEDLVETLRRATVEVERQAAVEGWTRDEIRKAIEDKWAEISKDDRNFKFVDRSGRAWENGRYCQMLARTTATRVYNDSFLDRLAEEGFNLVKVSSHGSEPDCDICRAWGGKICVISGKGGKYPTVEDARAAGVFHPNCMCTWEYVDEDEDRVELEKQALKAGEKVDWSDPEAVEKRMKGEDNPQPPAPPQWTPQTPLERTTDTFMHSIGAEHTDAPLPIEGVNPHYGEGRQWRTNCQRCVPTYEARARGYNVEAKPRITRNDPIFGSPVTPANWDFGCFKNPQPIQYSSKADIEAKMAEWGDGARAQINIAWAGGGAHTFTAVQENGHTKFLDPQHPSSDASQYFGRMSTRGRNAQFHSKFARVDNLEFSDKAKLAFKPSDIPPPSPGQAPAASPSR